MNTKYCISKRLFILLSFLAILFISVVALGNTNNEKRALNSRATESKLSVPSIMYATPIPGDPLDQPYYKKDKLSQCDTINKYIELYAQGASDTCYQGINDVGANVEKQLTTVSLFNRKIKVHMKALPAFNAVAEDLSEISLANQPKTVEGHYFKCNVNASGGVTDVCSSACQLSLHSFGIAVDINFGNDWNGSENYSMPMEVVYIFESHGFRWGGRYKKIFNSTIDPMHFEYMYDLCKGVM